MVTSAAGARYSPVNVHVGDGIPERQILRKVIGTLAS
jgi:hypothetical protein